MQQLVDAGIAVYNPDNPSRPVNSPKTVYQIEPAALELIRKFGSDEWGTALQRHVEAGGTLASRYAKEREMLRLPVTLATGQSIRLSPGDHSQLIKAIIEEFAERFAPGAVLIYAGDTSDKWVYFDQQLLAKLGVEIDGHGKMPDVVLYCADRKWLIPVEAVTSHGPVDGAALLMQSGMRNSPDFFRTQ